MTFNYYLSLGSNIEPRLEYLKKAISELNQYGQIVKKSELYQTEAWGNSDQNEFYNAIILFKSSIMPEQLMRIIKRIEYRLGRRPGGKKWQPREIDIDIIFADGITMNTKTLKIPHIHFANRKFVLQPMLNLIKNYRIAGKNHTIAELLDTCPDKSSVTCLNIPW